MQPAPANSPTIDPKAAILNLPAEQTEKRTLERGEAVFEVPMITPKAITPARSGAIYISCSEGIVGSMGTGLNGFSLMSNSDVAIHRNTSYQFKDGSGFQSGKIYSIVSCSAGTDRLLQREIRNLSPDLLQKKNLTLGQFVSEPTLMTPDGIQAKTSDLIPVSCSPNAKEGIEADKNGLILLPGSRVLIHRDKAYTFADGTTAANLPDYILISCEAAL